jgi:hypothetical protein
MIRARVTVPKVGCDAKLRAAFLEFAQKVANEVVIATDAPADAYDLTLHVLPDPKPAAKT